MTKQILLKDCDSSINRYIVPITKGAVEISYKYLFHSIKPSRYGRTMGRCENAKKRSHAVQHCPSVFITYWLLYAFIVFRIAFVGGQSSMISRMRPWSAMISYWRVPTRNSRTCCVNSLAVGP